jgi:anti-sigma regulatory factor (Ser/Thr protein kinase)
MQRAFYMSQDILSFKLKNRQTEAKKLFNCIEELGLSLGLAPKTVFGIALAIEELFTNIVSYGFRDDMDHLICVRIIYEKEVLVFRIEDDGLPFDPACAQEPDLKCTLEESAVGGLGIHIAKKMMDEFAYERMNDRNVITLKKYITDTK